MKLSHQLFVGVSLLLLLALLGALGVSFQQTRSYVATQLASHAQDAATSLGLSLAPAMQGGDPLVAERTVDALFDRGYYSEIRLVDVHGKTLLVRTLAPTLEGVPAWFARAVPLAVPVGESLITSGWRQMGRVIVSSHPGHAYRELWEVGRWLLLLFSATFAVSLVFLWLVLRAILAPLRDIEAQAGQIGQRIFREIARMPRVRELAAVVAALNRMTGKLKAAFEEQASALANARREAFHDSLTGLPNRRALEDRAIHLLRSAEEHPCGLLLMVEINGFRELNETHGYQRGDGLLRETADALAAVAGPSIFAARLGGAAFALLADGMSGADADAWAQEVQSELARIAEGDPELRVLGYALGGAAFDRERQLGALLAAADAALAVARARGPNGLAVHAPSATGDEPGAQAWRALLGQILAEGRLRLLGQVIKRLADGSAYAREITVQAIAEDGSILPAGRFAPVAERLGMAVDMDRAVIQIALLRLLGDATLDGRWAINLSARAAIAPEFVAWLASLLAAHPDLTRRLVFEVDELAVASHTREIISLAEQLRGLGSDLAIDRFAARHGAFGYLESVLPAYIKLDGSVVHDLHLRPDNRFFVRSLAAVAKVLDVPVIAPWVECREEWDCLEDLGVLAAQGYFTGRPEAL